MITDTFVVFDHPFQTVNIVSHVFLPNDTSSESIAAEYASAQKKIAALAAKINATEPLPLPVQQPIPKERAEAVSNIGKEGYKAHVRKMRDHIIKGDIIQAVPSQRLARPTALHPFNAYRYASLPFYYIISQAGIRYLRQINPSPYMFYLNCGEGLQLVGASPECLCKVDKSLVTNHAIAGTIMRGKTPAGAIHFCFVVYQLR